MILIHCREIGAKQTRFNPWLCAQRSKGEIDEIATIAIASSTCTSSTSHIARSAKLFTTTVALSNQVVDVKAPK